MGKTGDSFGRDYSYEEGRFSKNVRLNLNDLIQRRKDEKMTEKKMNLKIFSIAGGLAVCIVILVLSL